MAPPAARTEARAATGCATSAAATRRGARTVTIPAGTATLGADRAAMPFGWDNEFDAARVDVPRVRDRRPQRHQRASSSSSSTRAAIARASCGRTGAGCGARTTASRIRPSGTGVGGRLVLARHVREHPAARRVAGLCQRRGGGGVRALARPAAADRGRVSSRGVRIAGHQVERAVSLGRGRARFDAAAISTSRRRSRFPAGARPLGASAWGVHDLVGNGWEWTSTVFGPFPGSSRWRRTPSTPPTSSTGSTT